MGFVIGAGAQQQAELVYAVENLEAVFAHVEA